MVPSSAPSPLEGYRYEPPLTAPNIWVTNSTDNTVTKQRASVGTVLGTFPVGTTPVGIAFDGTNIWVTNQSSSNVTKLRAADGATLGTFAVGGASRFVAFDGTNIWVAIESSNEVIKLRPSDGTILGTFGVGASVHPGRAAELGSQSLPLLALLLTEPISVWRTTPLTQFPNSSSHGAKLPRVLEGALPDRRTWPNQIR
jgi:hypothetical protein